jgi:SpoVK/Ycf46/Vps4 family AAA+-type ATPase
LIKAFKKNDQKAVDKILSQLIAAAERRKQYKFAKKLREIYAAPTSSSSFSHASSLSPAAADNKRLFEVRKSKIDASRIVLSPTNRNILEEIVENYKKRDILHKHGLANDGRVILHGPPGTGKTLFAYVLAGELNLPIYHVYLDALVSSYLGETGKNLKAIFEEASREECVLLLDEFDAIAKHRDDSQELGELKRVVTVLLQNIDELTSRTILVAATNHEHLLDPAVWRRFEYSLKMDVLGAEARKSLLKLLLGEQSKLDLDLLTELSEGLSGAVIKQMVNRSLRKSLLNDDSDLQQQLIESFLVANVVHDERLKGTKRENFVRAIKYLRQADERRYTYEELERITGVASSTLHYLNQ